MLQNQEFLIIQLKKEKEKLNKLLSEKDIFINKLLNEQNENNFINLEKKMDMCLKEIHFEIDSFLENSSKKEEYDSTNLLGQKDYLLKKINELKQKFEVSLKNINDICNLLPINESPKLQKNGEVFSEIKYQQIEKELNELKLELSKYKEIEKELNLNINRMKLEFSEETREIIRKCDDEINSSKFETEKISKKIRKDFEEEIQRKIKENENLNLQNESLLLKIEKLISEKSNILESQQINEEKYEKIIKAMEDENEINKEKCSSLHQDYTLIHSHNNTKIHKCEKEIESKISEIHILNEQLSILSNKIQEEKNKKMDIHEQNGFLIDNKNQEILNLKIDLNKVETKLQKQNEEMSKLNTAHSIHLEKLEILLEEKESEINELRRSIQDGEDQLKEEKRKIQNILESSPISTLSIEENGKEKEKEENKFEKENDKIKNLKTIETENDKLKKELRVIKKSLKETLDLNDVFSRDLQKMKHKSYF